MPICVSQSAGTFVPSPAVYPDCSPDDYVLYRVGELLTLPALSIEEAASLGAVIALVLVMAYGFRILLKMRISGD
jgi:hypothetical protein